MEDLWESQIPWNDCPGFFWRSGEIDDFDVETSSEHNCAITRLCSLFISFVIPLELIIFPGFPAIPLNQLPFLL